MKRISDFEFHFQNIIRPSPCQENIQGSRGRAESARIPPRLASYWEKMKKDRAVRGRINIPWTGGQGMAGRKSAQSGASKSASVPAFDGQGFPGEIAAHRAGDA